MDDFDPRERLIGNGLRPEEGKIFYKHSFGKAPYSCRKISSPSREKCCQDVGHGIKKRCVVVNRKQQQGKRV